MQNSATLRVDSDDALRKLGLTAREAEVLYWVSQGKRNIEIGIILGARPRTITKHVEHIFEKLGVETRSAAAARAIEHLAGFATLPGVEYVLHRDDEGPLPRPALIPR
jgi:DNA-binding CsgD family transcriptional regulator